MSHCLLLNLEIDADLQRVADACRAWERCAREIGIGTEAINEIELALCEGVNNAIIHAYRDHSGGLVRVTAERQDRWLVLRIQDQGRAMDGQLIPPREFECGQEGGRGIGIICALMWHVHYSSGPEGNTLEMQYPLPDGGG